MNIHANMPRQLTSSKRQRDLLCALMVCTLLTPLPAFAQGVTGGGAGASEIAGSGSEGQLQDIVVTAQRREQKLQDVPVSVSAFGGEALRASGIDNVKDLAHLDPSLNIPQVVGVYLPFLRGIGNPAAGNLGNESSVPVYIDDMYYTRLSTAFLAINSIERVEVLKGPQGTLFGRNSTGGAIQMFTKDPGRDTEVNATVGYANYDRLNGQLYVSAPVTETLGWNLSVAGTDQSKGWGKSLADGHEIFKEKLASVRSKLLWEPSDATHVKLTGFYVYSKGDIGMVNDRHSGTYASTALFPSAVPGYPFPAVKLPSLADVPGHHFYDTRSNLPQFARAEGYGATLRIDQELGFADMVSITGFRNTKELIRLDADITPQNLINGDLNSKDRQVTQEFQLKSKTGSSVTWIVGAYYLHSNVKYNPIILYGDAFGGGTAEIRSRQIVDSYSTFGQATVPLAESTNLTLGLRYNIDHLQGDDPTFSGSKTFRKATWKGVFDHHFTDDVMAYASIGRGYKSAAYKTFPLGRTPVLPEIIDTYEVGIKTELFDRHVRLNGALFWNDIKNPQVLSVISVDGIPQIDLSNAQKARVKGGEVSLEVAAADGLTLRGALTYLDGKYLSFVNAPFYCLNGTTAVGLPEGYTCPAQTAKGANGNRLPNVAKVSFDLGANYVLDTGVGKWIADVSLSHTGRFAWNPDNYVFEKPVTLINASLNFTPESMNWLTVGVWGKNLGGVKYYSISQESTGLLGTAGFQAGAAAPRTYGGTVSFKF